MGKSCCHETKSQKAATLARLIIVATEKDEHQPVK